MMAREVEEEAEGDVMWRDESLGTALALLTPTNDVGYLKQLCEAREAELECVRLELRRGAAAEADKTELRALRGEVEEIRVKSVKQRGRYEESLRGRDEEIGQLMSKIKALEGGEGTGWLRSVVEQTCVCVPSDKATVQEAVLAALESGRTVFVRSGEHSWRRDMPISLSGNIRIVGEEGAVLKVTFQPWTTTLEMQTYPLSKLLFLLLLLLLMIMMMMMMMMMMMRLCGDAAVSLLGDGFSGSKHSIAPRGSRPYTFLARKGL